MTIELHANGKQVRNWRIDYDFGPFPMDDEMIEDKERDLKIHVLECKVDAGSVIYTDPWIMYAVVRSALRPEKIGEDDYAKFQVTVAKNKIKRAGYTAIKKAGL